MADGADGVTPNGHGHSRGRCRSSNASFGRGQRSDEEAPLIASCTPRDNDGEVIHAILCMRDKAMKNPTASNIPTHSTVAIQEISTLNRATAERHVPVVPSEEEVVRLGAENGEPEEVRFCVADLQQVAFCLRVPVHSLLRSLALPSAGWDRCAVEPNVQETAPSTPDRLSKQDSFIVNLHHHHHHHDASPEPREKSTEQSDSRKGTGIGLLLHTPDTHPSGTQTKEDAFTMWRDALFHPQETKSSVSIFQVPMGSAPPRLCAYLVLVPRSHQTGHSQQLVFAVPNLPDDLLLDYPGPCLGRPTEVSSVTVYRQPQERLLDDDPFSGVFISVELSHPFWAWLALMFAIATSCLVHPVVGKLREHADHVALVGVWWATGEFLGFLFLLLPMLCLRTWTRSEKEFFRISRKGVSWGVLYILLLGLLSGGEGASWVAAFGRGPSVQRFLLHALHPMLILCWRLSRRQQVFAAEALGIVIVMVGMVMVGYTGKSRSVAWDVHDTLALVSSLCMAGYLLAAKNIAAQVPIPALLFAVSLVAVFPTLFFALAEGVASDPLSPNGLLGWAGSAEAFRWWIFLVLLAVAKQAAYIEALRYLHPVAVSAGKCVDAVLAVFLGTYLFKNEMEHGVTLVWAIPGAIVVAIGGFGAAFVSVTRRLVVEAEVTKLTRRQHLRQELTATNLQRNQKAYGARLYASCETPEGAAR